MELNNTQLSSNTNDEKQMMNQDEIKNFREYLRIPSVHPNINYDQCIEFLEKQAKALELPYQIYKCAPDKPLFVMTWVGTEPNLPTIWLNSHMDVVPVYEDKWTYKPFDAYMDEKGDIYARGAQDMKCVGIQYLEAIKRLRKQNVTLKRTIHIAFVPEEELRGVMGMKDFTKTSDFKKLNVGFALDEGGPSDNNDFYVFYGEKSDWKVRVHCPGAQGHGSLLMPNPPGDKIGVIIKKFNEFRAQRFNEFMKDPTIANLGNISSINLTVLEGGVQANVVPPEFTATFDMRLADSLDFEEFDKLLNNWCKEAGDDVWLEYISKEPKVPYTKVDDSNPFWTAFKKATNELNLTLIPLVSPGNTDAGYIRRLGTPAIGFSPMNNTLLKLHDNDEYLNSEVFLKGIEIYTKIIPAVANVY